MSLINNVIRKIFGGTKSEKDIREILPLVTIINEFEEKDMARKKLIAGNWKMNGLLADGVELAKGVAQEVKALGKCDCEFYTDYSA